MPPAAKPCGLNQNAERLKNQGNEFHQKGQHRAAYRKYTDAIKEDPKNAVYYANRAATSLVLKEFMDAAVDAGKATELDPSYAKAWARLGTANFSLSAWDKSLNAWKRALDCLPAAGSEQETETDKKLRTQFSEGLQKADEMSQKPPIDPSKIVEIKIGENPWDRAMAQEQQLQAAQKLSSGFVILYAYRDFKAGVDKMKLLKEQPLNGQMGLFGQTGALADLSNGIMRDPRVFHFDSSDWIDKYNQQVMFEAEYHKAWDVGGAKTVMELAPQMLKREGWQAVRPALSTTIRAWLMAGFMSKSTGKLSRAMEFYDRVVDILDWGRRIWPNVSKEDRGVIFELSFVQGVKRLRLAALLEYVAAKENDCQYTMDDMAELARDLIAETEANPSPTGIDPGFHLSFWIYPKAEALSILGWYHVHLGLVTENVDDANLEFEQSAKYYIEAAETYPDDEEEVPLFLKCAIEAYWWQGKPLTVLIPLIIRIQQTIPKMSRFWEKSISSSRRDANIQDALEWGERVVDGLQDGSLAVDDVVKPKSIMDRDKGRTTNVIYI